MIGNEEKYSDMLKINWVEDSLIPWVLLILDIKHIMDVQIKS